VILTAFRRMTLEAIKEITSGFARAFHVVMKVLSERRTVVVPRDIPRENPDGIVSGLNLHHPVLCQNSFRHD